MPTETEVNDRPFTVLMVGAGNVSRSPLAERVGQAYLAEILGEGHEALFRLSSAGTHAVAGAQMDGDSALVLSGLGGEAERFWAQRLSADLVAAADLVLAMTRDEREDVLAVAPRALARTFTLLEAADLLARIDAPDRDLPERARNLVGAMAAARAGRRSSSADDVTDPAGRPLKVHQEVGEVVADAVLVVLGRLIGAPPTSSSAARRAAARGRSARASRRWLRTRPGST